MTALQPLNGMQSVMGISLRDRSLGEPDASDGIPCFRSRDRTAAFPGANEASNREITPSLQCTWKHQEARAGNISRFKSDQLGTQIPQLCRFSFVLGFLRGKLALKDVPS
jgi:hypothetical protein